MIQRQKEIQSYIFAAILIFASFCDSVYKPLSNGYEHSIQMEQKTRQHWIQDLKGNPLGDY
jgi:hypothetical protein